MLLLWTYIGTHGEMYCLCNSLQFLFTNTMVHFNHCKIVIVV